MIWTDITAFLDRGGPAMWVIAALSVATLTLILWKLMQFARLGAWRRGALRRLVNAPETAQDPPRPRDIRSDLGHAAIRAARDDTLTGAAAREEVTRVARAHLSEAQSGLRTLELISVIAPLVGLLGTVLGMIEAFQTLQDAGNRADPAALAGGIWQALLTTAAGMSVAIPAAAALSWFEGTVERIQADMEDAAVRIFGQYRGRR